MRKVLFRAVLPVLAVPLSAFSAMGQVTLTPSTLNFGNQVLMVPSSPKATTLMNSQSVALTISSITIGGGNASGDYSSTTNCPITPKTLPAGKSCNINVMLTASATGSRTATVTVTDNASNSPQTVSLTGTGVQPVALSTTSLNLGTVVVGNTGAAQNVTLTNNLKTTLTFTSIATSGDFAISSNTCGTSIAGGTQCKMGITFAPTATGARSGTLTFTDSASNSPQTVSLSGTGSSPVTLSTSTLTFGTRTVGTTSGTQSVVLTNHLTSALSISAPTSSGDFAVASNTCGTSVAAGQKCSIGVTFTPMQTGTRSGSLTISYSAFGSPSVVSLSGTGNVNGLSSITVTPANPSIFLGATQQFTATGTFNGGVMANITNAVTWASTATSVATISAGGLASSTGQGTSTISATISAISGTTVLTVNLPILTSITVTPANPSVTISTPQQFTATGNYSDGSMQNLTSSATWSSSATNVATIAAGGLASTISSGSTTIQAASGSINGSTTLTVTSGFISTGSLNTARFQHTATQLDDGTVLLAGGSGPTGVLASAEIYNPTAAAFTPTAGSLTTARDGQTATLLNSGTVLIVGGYGSSGVVGSAEIYNPANGTFTATTGNLNTARYQHTATLLSNGTVLIAGGEDSFGNTLASAELYSPATQSFTPITGSLNTARAFHTATLLNTGQVLIAGGQAPLPGCVTPPCNAVPMAAAELYNPATQSFTPTGSLNTARAYHTATLLNNGMALLAGGLDNNGNTLATAELYNFSSGNFSPTAGSLNTARYFHTATLLNNGTVLLAGGTGSSPSLASAETYDPTASTFTLTGSLNTARHSHTATLLNNGTVLMAGGSGSAGTLASAELYEPPSFTPPNLVSISLSPSAPTVSSGAAQPFTATGTFSDTTTQQLAAVTWSSSNSAVATITNDASDSGVAYGVANGTSTIKGCAGSVCGSASLTVGAALVSIAVTPANGSVPAGLSLQLTATGTYSDNSTQNLTSSVTWSSSAPNVATITAAGLANGLTLGSTTIMATLSSVQGTTLLTVSAPVLTSIAVTPSSETAIVGNMQQFTATGTYSDGSMQNVTSTVTWSSSATNVAAITTAGVVTSLATGTSSIAAAAGSVNGSTTLTVTSPLAVGTVSAVTSETCPATLGGHNTYWVTNTSGGLDYATTCYHATVSCPEMPDLGVTYGVATPSGTSAGTIVFISPSEGTFTLIGNYKGEAPFDLYHFGFQTVQFAWDSGWQNGSTVGSLKSAGCRIATFLSYMDTQFYLANSKNAATAGMCAESQSGGGGGLGYALTYYGAASYLDKAVFVSGPQYGGLVQGCWVPNYPPVTLCPNQNGVYAMGCNSLAGSWTEPEQYTGGAATKLGVQLADNPPCNDSSHVYTSGDAANLTAQSLVDGASDSSLYYPKTAITAWECDDDYYWQNPTESQGYIYLAQFTNPVQVAGNCNYSANNTSNPTACFSVNRVFGCTSLELASSGYVCNGNTCPVCTGNPPTNCTCGGVACSPASTSFAQKIVQEYDYEDLVNGCIKRH